MFEISADELARRTISRSGEQFYNSSRLARRIYASGKNSRVSYSKWFFGNLQVRVGAAAELEMTAELDALEYIVLKRLLADQSRRVTETTHS